MSESLKAVENQVLVLPQEKGVSQPKASSSELMVQVDTVRSMAKAAPVKIGRRALFSWLRIFVHHPGNGERVNLRIPIPIPLVGLLLPGLSRPPLIASALMLSAGVAWGIYTLRGRGAGDPTQVTAGNFVRAVPLGLALLIGVWLFAERPPVWDLAGVVLALTSGALTSGIGYAIWYAALPALRAATAATVQLSVPVITSLGGVLLLGEGLSLRLLLASVAILGGIALVIRVKR